jgi:predicted GTPase
MVESSEKIVICVLGQTGQGKSSFLNAFSGCHDKNQLIFKQGDSAESCTTKIKTFEGNVLGEQIVLVDVPGFKDSEGRDQQYLYDIL